MQPQRKNIFDKITQFPIESKVPLNICIKKVKEDKQNFKIVTLFLHNNRIHYYADKYGQKYIRSLILDFSIKYQLLHGESRNNKPGQVLGLRFFKGKEYLQFEFLQKNDVTVLTGFLQNRIKKIGFHQYFYASSLKFIGKGSFAEVFRGKRIQDQKIYAIKAISKRDNKDPQKRQVILTKQNTINLQIEVLWSLDHKNIVKLFQVCQTQNTVYLIMQYIKGPDLVVFFKQNPLYFRQQKNIYMIMKQLFQSKQQLIVMMYLEQKNIIHRDIKLQNIMLRSNNNLEIVFIDFGLADYIDSPKMLTKKAGSYGYVAPEILLETFKPAHNSDMFSIGALLYILIKRKHLFEGKTKPQLQQLNKQCKYSWDQFDSLQTSQITKTIIQLCCKRQPHQRITAQIAQNLLQHKIDRTEVKELLNQYFSPINVSRRCNQSSSSSTPNNSINLKRRQIQPLQQIPIAKAIYVELQSKDNQQKVKQVQKMLKLL